MTKSRLALLAFVLSAVCGRAAAQPAPLPPVHWVNIGSGVANPVDRGSHFDLAFGPDQVPILVTRGSHGFAAKRLAGNQWSPLATFTYTDAFPTHIGAAYNWAGDIIVGVRLSEPFGSSVQIFRLIGSALIPVGPRLPAAGNSFAFAVAIDARGPVVALVDEGAIMVKRWNGTSWVRLGSPIAPASDALRDSRAISLAVTGDGRLVVAYARTDGTSTAIEAKALTGSSWTTLGSGLAAPARSPNLGGMASGSPALAALSGDPRVSVWNGTSWLSALTPPCPSPPVGNIAGRPVLAINENQLRIVCATHSTVVLDARLFARAFTLFNGWVPLGTGSINGAIRLPPPLDLSFVARTAPGGQLWVAWTAASDAGGPAIIVSTLVPSAL